MGVFMFDFNLNFTLKKLRKNRQSLFSFKLHRAKLLSFDDSKIQSFFSLIKLHDRFTIALLFKEKVKQIIA